MKLEKGKKQRTNFVEHIRKLLMITYYATEIKEITKSMLIGDFLGTLSYIRSAFPAWQHFLL